MNENELARIIVDKCLKIHKTLGPGIVALRLCAFARKFKMNIFFNH